MEARGWLTPKDSQGQDQEIANLMQTWAGEYDDVRALEAALDSARIPLGVVKAVKDIPDEPWAQERGIFVDIDIDGAACRIPRSPTRFSNYASGPSKGSSYRGADNVQVLRSELGLNDAELKTLQDSQVILSEKPLEAP